MGKSVSNIIARSTLHFLRENGVNTDAIRAQCQLSQYELDKSDGRISDKQHLRFIKETEPYDFLWQERMRQTDADDQIISGAYALFPELVGYCLNQKNAEEAVLGYIRNRVIIGNCDNFVLRKEREHLAIGYVEESGMPQRNYSAIGNFMLLRALVRLYAPTTKSAVSLRGSDERGRKRLDDAFGCHCQFGQEANIIYFKGADLASPAETYLPLLNKNQHQLITRKVAALEHEQGFSSLIYSLLDEVIENDHIQDETSFMDHICAVMGMSRWTINIRLGQEETNLSLLLKKVRINKSCRWLAETNLSVQDISERLRFSSLSVFSRFFSTHMGSSPLHYRRRLGQRI
ncbi:AraC-like DNA-binding protein [Aeromonas sp. BIGb0405]|uniref:AraC family transcriptional regulator n=1 Tax=Aeromonas sp. BIGb0405 TaxID=2940592 RepID=UPI0021671287|nr:AraC family transcriptional regulator [Aeromonas sp. BIGb0405]MCS3455638.1 AraC-like DNA-binding protein [Aeromonas sp. BIGb0405]